MAKLITFYIPEGFKPAVNWSIQTETGKVLEFRVATLLKTSA
jgi:hypothetical protein